MMQENLVLASDLVVSHVLADKPGFCKLHQRQNVWGFAPFVPPFFPGKLLNKKRYLICKT